MTLTDIANIALEDIGAKAIGNIDGDDVNARKVKRKILLSIETVSARRNWCCLRKEIKLTRMAEDDSETGWHKFNRPNGMMCVISSSAPFKAMGEFILCPEDELKVLCVIVSYNPDEWDVLLRNSIIAQLKYDIAISVTGNGELATTMLQLADLEIKQNMLHDAYNEKNRVIQRRSDWFREI